MAKPNYAFAKRQRDLAKRQKKEEKRRRKLEKSDDPPQDGESASTGEETKENTQDS